GLQVKFHGAGVCERFGFQLTHGLLAFARGKQFQIAPVLNFDSSGHSAHARKLAFPVSLGKRRLLSVQKTGGSVRLDQGGKINPPYFAALASWSSCILQCSVRFHSFDASPADRSM